MSIPTTDRHASATLPEYSPRLGRIFPVQFQAALDRFGLGRFVRAAPITAGLFGQNVFVTSTTGEYVLRGCPHYPWQFPAERFFAHQLHQHTRAPAPWPYLIDPAEDIFGWSYALMPRMPGVQLSDAAVIAGLTREDRRAIARALGRNLALMQELTWSCAGEYDLATDTVRPFLDTHRDRVRAAIDQRLRRARQHSDRTTSADVSWAHAVIDAAWGALDESFTPCFVMTDYKEQNATAERRGAGWRIAGVFDLMEGHFDNGEMDLCRQIGLYLERDPALAAEFVQAYLARKPARPGLVARLPIYLLRERLIIWEYCQRPGNTSHWDPQLTLREWAEPFVEAATQLAAR